MLRAAALALALGLAAGLVRPDVAPPSWGAGSGHREAEAEAEEAPRPPEAPAPAASPGRERASQFLRQAMEVMSGDGVGFRDAYKKGKAEAKRIWKEKRNADKEGFMTAARKRYRTEKENKKVSDEKKAYYKEQRQKIFEKSKAKAEAEESG
mmetsp:Transcript_64277/g.182520  ORF Transcript_64277/g.182520 Transcript_64277/m.182520 type:complete len:152 (-) Transcript_64277:104-559(-)